MKIVPYADDVITEMSKAEGHKCYEILKERSRTVRLEIKAYKTKAFRMKTTRRKLENDTDGEDNIDVIPELHIWGGKWTGSMTSHRKHGIVKETKAFYALHTVLKSSLVLRNTKVSYI